MPLELQLKRSKYFYGRIEVDGKRRFFSLGVRVAGTPPVSLRDEGDAAFERARARAQAKLDQVEAELRSRASREELAQRVLELRTGSRLGSVLLSDLPKRWSELPRSRTPSERYVSDRTAVLRRFVEFIERTYPSTKEMSAVREEMAAAFLAAEFTRGITAKTYNEALKLLRSCFKHLRKAAGLAENPFDDLPTKETDTIHRRPFTIPEVEAISRASVADPYIHRLIVTGLCTAMRLGDCAKLCWEHVNLRDGFVDVKTSKTRRLATIPIFPILLHVLEGLVPQREGYVFPDLAQQYAVNPKLLTQRVRKILSSVGFGDTEPNDQVSRGAYHAKRERGLRRASIRDFQSFRVTWVTIALNANVPLDLVRKVTGHQTVEVVLTSYHQPGRDDFRRVLSEKLPRALTGGRSNESSSEPAQSEALLAKLAVMTADNWLEIREEMVEMLRKRGHPRQT